MRVCRIVSMLAISICLGGGVPADDSWPEWRGPTGQGTSDATNLPVSWDDDHHVAWKLPIAGRGHSTPVIGGGRLWLTTGIDIESSKEAAAKRREKSTNSMPLRVSDFVSLHAICVNIATGRIEHDVEVLTQANPQMIYFDNSYATPSPILSGGRLYCDFGACGVVCLNTETARVQWTNRDLVVEHENGPGSSPVLWEKLLILHRDGIDQQYIAALDLATGDLVWKTPRSGKLHKNPQLRKAYATPLLVTIGGRQQIISPAADWLYSYDPGSGKELWKVSYGDLGFSNSARPVAGDGVIYNCTGFMKSRLLAVDAGADTAPTVKWQYKKQVPNVSSPLLVGKHLYFASDTGIASCVDAETGTTVWNERIGARFWAAPLYADSKLYFPGRDGTTVVMAAGTEPKILSRNRLDGELFASPVPIDGALFLRTDKALYRLEP